MYKIRPFQKNDTEYKTILEIGNALYPNHSETIEELIHADKTRDTKYLFQRFVVELDGKIVAFASYCEPSWSYKPGKYYIDINVHPDFQRHGIGKALYYRIMEILSEYKPMLLTSGTMEDKTYAILFLTKRDFKQVMREPISQLELANFDPSRFADVFDEMNKLSIKIQSLTEIQNNDINWKRKLWDLDWEIDQDIPSPEPFTRTSFENFVKQVLNHPKFNPYLYFIAIDKNRWVGLSALSQNKAEPEKLTTYLTGVVRTHRRKKIATAMKLRGIQVAKKCGVKIIKTDNEENNPMYFLNQKLGFTPKSAWISFHKKIKQTATKISGGNHHYENN